MRTLDRRRAPSAGGTGPCAPDFLDAVPTSRRRRARGTTYGRLGLTARLLGAVSLLVVGAVHLQQYDKLYSQIPTIGTLFVLNFAGATALALAIVAPLERIGGRRGHLIITLAAAGGVALAAVSFAFLLVSEQTPLFGFMEPGYDPTAITVARAAEVATVLLLGSFLLARAARPNSTYRW